jgi:hypothetical protein
MVWNFWCILMSKVVMYGGKCDNKEWDLNWEHLLCIFDKVLASFWHLTCKNLHTKKCTSIDTRTLFNNLTCSVTCERSTACQLTHSKLKWHVVLDMWHWGDILEKKIKMSVDIHFCFWKRHVTLWIWSWPSNQNCQTYTLHIYVP